MNIFKKKSEVERLREELVETKKLSDFTYKTPEADVRFILTNPHAEGDPEYREAVVRINPLVPSFQFWESIKGYENLIKCVTAAEFDLSNKIRTWNLRHTQAAREAEIKKKNGEALGMSLTSMLNSTPPTEPGQATGFMLWTAGGIIIPIAEVQSKVESVAKIYIKELGVLPKKPVTTSPLYRSGVHSVHLELVFK